MNQIKETFYGQAKLTNGERPELQSIKESWNNFSTFFWVIFLSHIVIKGMLLQEDASLNLFLIQFVPYLAMVTLMGYFAYKFSKQKISVLYGLWGFLWVAVVGIFIGYFAVRRLRNKAVEKLSLESA